MIPFETSGNVSRSTATTIIFLLEQWLSVGVVFDVVTSDAGSTDTRHFIEKTKDVFEHFLFRHQYTRQYFTY